MNDNPSDEKSPEKKPELDAIDGIPVLGVPSEIMEKLPPNVQQQITSLLISQQRYGSAPNPLVSKITPEHIDKLIDSSEKDSVREHENRGHDRLAHAFYVVLFLGVFVFLVWFMIDKNKDLLTELIRYLLAFAGGFGLKAYIDRDSR